MISVRRIAVMAMSALLLPAGAAWAQGRGAGAGSADGSGATATVLGGEQVKTDRSRGEGSESKPASSKDERSGETRQGRRASRPHRTTDRSNDSQREPLDTGGGR